MQSTKILWHSNAPHAPTGYGNQTGLFTPLIHKDYGCTISAFYGRQGASIVNKHGIMELPIVEEPYGNDIISSYAQYTKAEIVISLLDAYVCRPDIWGKLNWIAWLPIDRVGIDRDTLRVLPYCKRIWAMSHFGEQQLLDAGYTNVDYVPHGVDTDVFKPVSDRRQARKVFLNWLGETQGVRFNDDVFIVMTNAANKGKPSRKNFNGMFAAFDKFHAKYPNSIFYVHTKSVSAIGEDLQAIAKNYRCHDSIFFTNELAFFTGNLDAQTLNNFYNAADVFLLLSYGEGFGIPVLEAQAAGCPVIVSDGSALHELSKVGLRVPCTSTEAWLGGEGGFWHVPNTSVAAKHLETIYNDKHVDLRRRAAHEFAQDYDYRKVYEQYMRPAIERFFEIRNQAFNAITTPHTHKRPDISVVMACYNNADTLERAIESVLSHDNVELIIVDDASEDNTREVLSAYEHRDNVKVLYLPNGVGQANALNEGIKYVTGRYVCKLDGDDYFAENALTKVVQALDNEPEKGFAVACTQEFGLRNRYIKPKAFTASDLLRANHAYGEVVYRAEVHLLHGLKYRAMIKDENGRGFGAVDYDFVLQMMHTLGLQPLILDDVLLLHYNVHENSMNALSKQYSNEIINAMRHYWKRLELNQI
ncbi:MAG: hypothetical protein KatS3mg087_1793 [Patescibacteria group bacterium]|nr:MAG: hypothetical protein KatS3mg087_1793 [Patescibacteria group bacterium]